MVKQDLARLEFAPVHFQVIFIYLGLSLFVLCAPLAWSSGSALNFMAQVCIAAIFGLAFNMLLGQTGLLSFGHAVYAGLGAFVAIHVMNKLSVNAWPIPLSLIPLIGGLAGMFFGFLFAIISTKRSGITFSMISLGIAELVFACSLMFPGFFGGEGGISANRVSGASFLGVSFGPQIEVTYLIIFWTIFCFFAILYLRATPLGKLANAVRDNPERVAFIGFNTRWVRVLMLTFSSFFAGVAGGLSAINFEIVSAENLGAARSGAVLLFTFIGGTRYFAGPVVGALAGVVMTTYLSEFSPAWQLYTGLLFMVVVLFAPEGISGIVVRLVNVTLEAKKTLQLDAFLKKAMAYLFSSGLLVLGIILSVEMLYRLRLNTINNGSATILRFFDLPIDCRLFSSWLFPSLLIALGVLSLRLCRRFFPLEDRVKKVDVI